MVYCEDKQYKKYNQDMFRIRGNFTAWHALYLFVPFFVAALIPYLYLSAGSSVATNPTDDGVELVATVETANTVASFSEPVAATKNKILFVGDSITTGMTNCNYAIAQCEQVAESAVSREIDLLGKDGFAAKLAETEAQTTAEHLEKGLDVEGADIAQIMLGANDAGMGITSQQYKQNMQSIVDTLLSSGVKKVMINKPIFAASVSDKINQYWQYLQTEPNIFDDPRVVKGDEEAYDWFASRSYLLDGDGGGFHPDEYGYEVLGQFWAKALQRVIEADTPAAL